MQTAIRLTALTFAMAATSALAAPPQYASRQQAMLRMQHAQGQARTTPALTLRTSVGDPDSFGRSVTYMGMIASASIDLKESGCQPSTGPGDQCVTLNPQPQSTSFTFNDVGHITLPGGSTHSLLCFQTSALNSWQFHNNTMTAQYAQISLNETVTIESPLLTDRSLIDPTTGQPFNGKLTAWIGLLASHWATLQPGAEQGDSGWVTRGCEGGAISKAQLRQVYGLSDKIADQFFQMPITIRLNASGDAQLVEWGGMSFGVRFYGD